MIKKIIFFIFLVFIISSCTKTNYTIAEVTNQTCKINSDCELPFDYTIRSICPYESQCIKNYCTVVCPEPFEHPK